MCERQWMIHHTIGRVAIPPRDDRGRLALLGIGCEEISCRTRQNVHFAFGVARRESGIRRSLQRFVVVTARDKDGGVSHFVDDPALESRPEEREKEHLLEKDWCAPNLIDTGVDGPRAPPSGSDIPSDATNRPSTPSSTVGGSTPWDSGGYRRASVDSASGNPTGFGCTTILPIDGVHPDPRVRSSTCAEAGPQHVLRTCS